MRFSFSKLFGISEIELRPGWKDPSEEVQRKEFLPLPLLRVGNRSCSREYRIEVKHVRSAAVVLLFETSAASKALTTMKAVTKSD